MKNRKTSVIFLTGCAVLATAFLVGAKAQQKAEFIGAAMPDGSAKMQVLDVTEPNRTWPRTHLVYDFERRTLSIVSINPINAAYKRPIIQVLEVTNLDKVNAQPLPAE